MADETRHAAWHERRFAVRLLPEQGDPTELVDGLDDFLEAVDFAVEWLAREDPERTGTASLAIYETSAGTVEKVWAYPPDDEPEAAPLLKIFGFDPVNWKSAASEFTPPRPPPTPRIAPQRRPEPQWREQPPAIAVAAAAVAVPAAVRPRLQPRRALSAAWADPVSRACLLLGGVALWLALALGNAGLLALVFVSLLGLWWRREKLVGTAETDAEDWL